MRSESARKLVLHLPGHRGLGGVAGELVEARAARLRDGERGRAVRGGVQRGVLCAVLCGSVGGGGEAQRNGQCGDDTHLGTV